MSDPKTIALIEDEESLAKSLTDFLEAKGYRVINARDGIKGLFLIRANLPDLVVLDVMMPRLDGFHVLDRIKTGSKTMDIPVLLLTVRSSREDIERGIQHMAEEYITKPFEPEHLLERIRQILNTRNK
ncbi:MAG: response regulator [Candidatus Omnitrophica bacterium]|nr:response regulator [Candidatus Omnitrophota bacterium]